MPEQIPFATDSFADNPEPRCPAILLLDVSGSMQGQPISTLNSGIQEFKYALQQDVLAAKRVEVAIITFGSSVTTMCDWVTADSFMPPTLAAAGTTPMGEAIGEAISMLRFRKDTYRANGILYYRPWIFLITDGEPTDSWQHAAELIKQGEAKKEFAFFCVGTEGANFAKLKQISVREPIKLQGLRFRELFLWLSTSLQAVSRSNPGDEVPLPSPSGWAAV